MTATQFADSKYKPMAFSMPFGANNAANYVMPKTAQDASNPNFLDGFPSAYSAPKSGGGKYVTREEMNGIGNLASRFEFFRRVGGLVTFDAALASSIGGYPAGCVLDYLDGYNLHKVFSLVDNNSVDFTSVGVDNVNWAFLNVDQAQIGTTAFAVSGIPNASATLGVFRASKTGMLILDSDIKQEFSEGTYTISYPGPGEFRETEGWAIAMVDLGSGSSPSTFPSVTWYNTSQTVNWNGYTSVVGTMSTIFFKQSGTNVSWTYTGTVPPQSNLAVTKDHWYGLVLWNWNGRECSIYEMTTGANASSFTLMARPFTVAGSFRLYYAQ